MNEKLCDMSNYYTCEELLDDCLFLQAKYDEIVNCDIIGRSVLGRDIIMLSAGTGDTNLFITAGVHGRESINTRLIMNIMESNIDIYHSTGFFNKYCFRIIPLVNPDGYVRALTGKKYADYKCNAKGIDINRDFPSRLWKPCGSSYIYPASQPETRAVMNAFKKYPSVMYVDIHSRGNAIYYHRQTMSVEYNIRQLNIAKKLAEHTGYRLMPPDEEINPDDSGGNTVHYYSEEYNMPAITIETCDDNEQFPMRPELVEESYNVLSELPVLMTQYL